MLKRVKFCGSISLYVIIAVIYEGKIVGIVDAKTTDENTLGLMMAGGAEDEQ